ncbi:hypothetical protein AVEN_167234-1 [Araneus ventricosus]|uniref:Uncharacterized protein n=1 Tax=Araneus ventricosus TaxID=182803 RepID=A0A4Y2NBY2_ARAVE|nr:hypothetical protein AVEN_167234-1 [Araneus ventricosus]
MIMARRNRSSTIMLSKNGHGVIPVSRPKGKYQFPESYALLLVGLERHFYCELLFLPNQTINLVKYSSQIDNLKKVSDQKHLDSTNREGMVFHED